VSAGKPPESGAAHHSDEPRFKRWSREGSFALPVWLWPGVVVVVTASLGGPHGHPRAAAVWIAFVCAWLAGVGASIALEPAPYARRAAGALSALVGLVTLALLLSQLGQPLP
jgi:hypothetical protein